MTPSEPENNFIEFLVQFRIEILVARPILNFLIFGPAGSEPKKYFLVPKRFPRATLTTCSSVSAISIAAPIYGQKYEISNLGALLRHHADRNCRKFAAQIPKQSDANQILFLSRLIFEKFDPEGCQGVWIFGTCR